MKTITLEQPYNFLQALQKLVDGECLGIKPGTNTNYMHLNPSSKTRLIWCRNSSIDNDEDGTCRAQQFLTDPWYLVIADHRELTHQ